MDLQVLQENLSKALSTCLRFTSSKVQLPVLANILLRTNKNKLLLSATNLETSVSVQVGAKVIKEGSLTIPARVITELVNNLGPGQVNLSSDKENLKIKTQNFESVISGMSSSEFPNVPSETGAQSFRISSKNLLDALSITLFAVSVDETRPVLTGVLILIDKETLTLVATDGFRLSQKKITIDKSKEEIKLILPKGVLSELARLSDNEFVNFSYKRSDNQVVLGLSDSVLSSRVIEGEFPDFERIIPKETKIKVKVDKDELLRSIKLAGVFARDSANVVKLTTSENSLEVLAESSLSGSQKTSIDAKIENGVSGAFTIAFNYRFVEDFLNTVKGESISLEFSDPNSPALFLDDKDTNYLHIIMPVKLQS